MAVNADKPLSTCKKCGELHDKPLHGKCERNKNKDEKRDQSHEHSTKKTLRGKTLSENSQEKMLDFVIQTMTGFTDKLTAMEEKLNGLSSRVDSSKGETSTVKRQSRSREKAKRVELFAEGEDETSLFSPLDTLQATNENITYSQTFPDTAVLVKQTPARAKKHKGNTDLGVTPLANVSLFTNAPMAQAAKNALLRVTSTVSKPTGTSSVSWPTNVDSLHGDKLEISTLMYSRISIVT